MARRPGRPTAGSERLSRERVVAAALARIDREGMAALTIRGLAADLGVDPMAIYHHVPGKAALVEAVVEAVFGGLRPAPAGDLAWPERVRRFARGYRTVVRSHPHLIRHVVAHAAAAPPAAMAAADDAYAALEAAGLPPEAVVRGVDLLVDWVHGFALAEADVLTGGGGAGRAAAAARLAAAPGAEAPALRRAVAAVLDGGGGAAFATVEADLDASFAFGLEVILGGLAALADGSEAGRAD
jgi:TetR/AcrR family transcriptional regulator, tetracycline repressor protein